MYDVANGDGTTAEYWRSVFIFQNQSRVNRHGIDDLENRCTEHLLQIASLKNDLDSALDLVEAWRSKYTLLREENIRLKTTISVLTDLRPDVCGSANGSVGDAGRLITVEKKELPKPVFFGELQNFDKEKRLNKGFLEMLKQ